MRHPLSLSASGRYAEGLVELPGLWSGSDLTAPTGQRPAVYQAKGAVGFEADLEVVQGAAWIAIQLDKASRYRELVRRLIEQGLLALAPGALTRPATKSASGLFESLPLGEWAVAPLRVPGGTYSVSASDVARRFEAAHTPLSQSTWALLDAQIKQETEAVRNDR